MIKVRLNIMPSGVGAESKVLRHPYAREAVSKLQKSARHPVSIWVLRQPQEHKGATKISLNYCQCEVKILPACFGNLFPKHTSYPLRCFGNLFPKPPIYPLEKISFSLHIKKHILFRGDVEEMGLGHIDTDADFIAD